MIPQPKHILIDKDEEGNITTRVFREKQNQHEFLNILGYE
jgi:arginine decarboxylase